MLIFRSVLWSRYDYFPFHRWGNWCTERLNNFPEVTQLGRNWAWFNSIWLQSLFITTPYPALYWHVSVDTLLCTDTTLLDGKTNADCSSGSASPPSQPLCGSKPVPDVMYCGKNDRWQGLACSELGLTQCCPSPPPSPHWPSGGRVRSPRKGLNLTCCSKPWLVILPLHEGQEATWTLVMKLKFFHACLGLWVKGTTYKQEVFRSAPRRTDTYWPGRGRPARLPWNASGCCQEGEGEGEGRKTLKFLGTLDFC